MIRSLLLFIHQFFCNLYAALLKHLRNVNDLFIQKLDFLDFFIITHMVLLLLVLLDICLLHFFLLTNIIRFNVLIPFFFEFPIETRDLFVFLYLII